MNFPPGCQDPGVCGLGLSVSRCASPVPSARCQYRLRLLSRLDRKTMRWPSGVHTGFWSAAASFVMRVSVSRDHSHTHTSVCPGPLSMASRLPSGATLGLLQFAGAARSDDTSPARFIHWMGASLLAFDPAT